MASIELILFVLGFSVLAAIFFLVGVNMWIMAFKDTISAKELRRQQHLDDQMELEYLDNRRSFLERCLDI